MKDLYRSKGRGAMKKETRHFYFIIGIIFIVMGLASFTYGHIIPTVFPRNTLPSLIFLVTGIIFIVIGVILVLVLRKQWRLQENILTEGGLE
jgi:uncharacterized membrane protein